MADRQRTNPLLVVVLVTCMAIFGTLVALAVANQPQSPGAAVTTVASTTSTTTPPLDLGDLARYVNENFSETFWYPAVLDYEHFAGGVLVRTTLSDVDAEAAGPICGAVTLWKHEEIYPVFVRGARDVTFARALKGAGTCRLVD
jgi:hypothetical protein